MLEEGFVLAHEPLLRLGSFAAVFIAVALWELAAPRRSSECRAHNAGQPTSPWPR